MLNYFCKNNLTGGKAFAACLFYTKKVHYFSVVLATRRRVRTSQKRCRRVVRKIQFPIKRWAFDGKLDLKEAMISMVAGDHGNHSFFIRGLPMTSGDDLYARGFEVT